jgi:hypothetical protein
MKPSRTNRKRMYVGCYNHINHENLKHNGNVGGRRKTRKTKTHMNKSKSKSKTKRIRRFSIYCKSSI